jgi:hypothetical protein
MWWWLLLLLLTVRCEGEELVAPSKFFLHTRKNAADTSAAKHNDARARGS